MSCGLGDFEALELYLANVVCVCWMVSASVDAVRVAPGLPDFGSESAAVGHGQADAAGPGADLGGAGFRRGGCPIEVCGLDRVAG